MIDQPQQKMLQRNDEDSMLSVLNDLDSINIELFLPSSVPPTQKNNDTNHVKDPTPIPQVEEPKKSEFYTFLGVRDREKRKAAIEADKKVQLIKVSVKEDSVEVKPKPLQPEVAQIIKTENSLQNTIMDCFNKITPKSQKLQQRKLK